MHILMYGWEYPPKHNGGLGIACHGLANALNELDHQVTFVLPKVDQKKIPITSSESKEEIEDKTELVDVSTIKEEKITEKIKSLDISYHEIGTQLLPYLSVEDFKPQVEKVVKEVETFETKTIQKEVKLLKRIKLTGEYNKALLAETTKYAIMSSTVIEPGDYDVIHAHDWMSFKAGLLARETLNIPLILHVHSTEFDRNGAFVNPEIEKQEREGLEKCNHIITVSEKVKRHITDHYDIDESKVTVIPNAITQKDFPNAPTRKRKKKKIGFIGRLVHQKGPDKFIDVARDISNQHPNYEFVMAGDGYMKDEIEAKIAGLNLLNKVTLLGFQDRDEIRKLLKDLDLMIVPSVSEPFGLSALEAVAAHVPVIIAEGAGILEHIDLLTYQHWNTYGLTKLVDKVLSDDAFKKEYIKRCSQQLKPLTWSKTAKATAKLYQKIKKQYQKEVLA